jgi:hypothetical protein
MIKVPPVLIVKANRNLNLPARLAEVIAQIGGHAIAVPMHQKD